MMVTTSRLVVVTLALLGVASAGSSACAAQPGTRIVRGWVRFDGPQPQRQTIELRDRDGKLSDCHQLHPRVLLEESLLVADDSSLANAFVYVRKGYPRKKYPPPKTPAVLNQVGCMFRPRVQGVMLGQEFVMKNGDPVLHNVRALSFRNRPFNVAQPANSADRSKTFSRREKAVTIQCDLHPWMKAFCFVMDHPWFTVTDANGHFELPPLPVGEYTISAWHEELGEQSAEVAVTTEAHSPVEFHFKPRKSNVVIPKVTTVTPRQTSAASSPVTAPQRSFVRRWSVEDLSADAVDVTTREGANGRAVFEQAGCVKCHVFAGRGEKYGPELTDVVKRFQGVKLLEQVLKPSSEIHKDFRTQMFLTTDGRVVTGLVIKDDADQVHVLPNPLQPLTIEVVRKEEIDERQESPLSTMPEGLLDTFSRDEILDLMSYLQSGTK